MDNHTESNHLQHHGVKGQKWGVRRYQNKDGSLTPLGERRMNQKTPADKKAIENLKDQRTARLLNVVKQAQAMRQESLDRANARKIARGKLELEKQKAKDESLDKENARKLANEKTKIDKKDQQDRSRDKQSDRELAKQRLKMEIEKMRNEAKADKAPKEEYYELPDTPERQKASGISGKSLAIGALAVAGTVALAVAAKKYGPALMDKMKGSKQDDSGDDTPDPVKEMVKEVAKAATTTSIPVPKASASTSVKTVRKTAGARALPAGRSSVAGLLAAPKSSGPSFSSRLKTAVKNAEARNAKRRQISEGMKIYREASKLRGSTYDPSAKISGYLPAASSSAKSTVNTVSNVVKSIGDIPLYMGS